jgi:hypothetical protein
LIHLVSSNKDGAVSRGAMMMTIGLRMLFVGNIAYIKFLGDLEQTAMLTLILTTRRFCGDTRSSIGVLYGYFYGIFNLSTI